MKLKPLIIALLGLAVITAAVLYWPASPPTTPQQQVKGGKGKRFAGPPSTDPVPVRATVARRADVPVYLDGVGTARALNTVLVKPQVEGKLIAVSFTEGQDVSRGYVLAKIDPTTYQAQYDQAVATKAHREAQLANARLDLERYTKLAASNAVNKQQVDTQRALVAQLEAQVRADQAAIDNARAILSYTEITAPIAGRTGIRQVDEGNIVRPSDTTGLVVITQIRPISVLFNLPQQHLPELNRGMAQGPLSVDAMGPDGRTIVDRGKVLVIDNQVDPTTGTVRLKAEFPNENLQLWPGQFVNVRLLIDTLRQVVVVPTSAVQRGPVGTFVFAIGDDSTVSVRRVTVSRQDDIRAVIGDGLAPEDRIVTSGFARIAENTRVEVTATEEVGQPPVLPTVEGAPRAKQGKGAGKDAGKGGGKGGKGAAGSTDAGGSSQVPSPVTQGAGAKSSATP
ncbi:MAG: efflux RND transporter periplasmic adaptor subunit [Hyphomicrobiales bacterium]|nr:efflux RND transporter periplasmic adaptor subunit [Hyphomicrobiales bacterium]